MKLAQKTYDRIKDILKQDKNKITEPFLKEVKSELFLTLNQFFDLKLEDINLNYFINNNNLYEVSIKFVSSDIKKVNYF